jgi:acid phosphatase
MRVVVFIAVLIIAASAAPLSFTVLGDWGNPIHFAKHIAKRSDQVNSKFTLALGDNFYMNGVKSTKDRLWKTVFENVYKQPFFQKRWYVLVGNHDYSGSVQAQIDYTKKSKRWYFPRRYYSFTKKLSATETVDFVMLDTTPLYYAGKKDPAQIQWLKKTLAASKADMIIVLGHHQIYSLGGNNDYMIKTLVPILEKHKVTTYICGHHHSEQHLKSPKLSYIVSGNVGAQDPCPRKSVGRKGVQTKFFFPTPAQFKKLSPSFAARGFTTMTVTDVKTLTFTFFDARNNVLYRGTVKNPRAK